MLGSICFSMRFRLMAIGYQCQDMEMYGIPQPLDLTGDHIPMGAGYCQTMDGHGYLTSLGAGLHTTMGDGCFLIITDGDGYLVQFGHQHGLLGIAVLATLGGLLLPLIITSSLK